MKKLLLCALLSMLFSSGIIAQTATPPAAGDGTSSNPYQIATLENLYWLSQTSSVWYSHFLQTSDIDASPTSSWPDGWTPIANNQNFDGSYNGQGHIISGLYSRKQNTHSFALFSHTGRAVISNLGLIDINIECPGTAGGLIGFSNQTIISNCFVSGHVKGIGFKDGLHNASCAGGLIGRSDASTISNCYARVSVDGDYAGGLIGMNFTSTIKHCYSAGTLTGTQGRGGIVGFNYSSSINTSFYDKSIAWQNDTGVGIPKTTDEMKTQVTFSVWDFSSVWAISNGYNNGYPCLLLQIPVSSRVVPTVSTQAVSGITATTATGHGTITNLGIPDPISYGIVWNITGTPTTADNKTDNGSIAATGAFTARFTNLLASTTYYARTYVKNVTGTNYGEVVNFTTDPFYAVAPSSGTGSIDDPYQVTNIENLYWISQTPSVWSSSFIQTANIYAASSGITDGGHGWIPIGNNGMPFKGKYNGQGYSISGLTISRPLSDDQGLFGVADGAGICNLGLSDLNITGANYTGGLVGKTINTSINNCYTTGGVIGTGYVGGLIGNNTSSSISNCYAAGSVSGTSNNGGLIGASSSSVISNCFYDTSTSGLTDTGKGNPQTTAEMKTQSSFTGWDFNLTWALSSSYNNGYPFFMNQIPVSSRLLTSVTTKIISNITSTTATGGGTIEVLGVPNPNAYGIVWNTTGSATISDSRTDLGAATLTGDFTINMTGLIPNTTYFVRAYAINCGVPQYGEESFFYSSPLKVIPPTQGDGSSANPYEIATLENLYWLSQTSSVWGSNFIQTANIDASYTSSWINGGWTPVGTEEIQFTGQYNGQGFSISGLTISKSFSNCQGMFGFINGASISNLGLFDVDITGQDNVGGLIGSSSNISKVSKCFVTGDIVASGYRSAVGGLIGSNHQTNIDQCFAAVNVIANIDNVQVGGMIGFNLGSDIYNCYATGNITANGQSASVGGLIGNNDVSEIHNCYASGIITAGGSNPLAGGLAGRKNNTSVKIFNCFYDASTTGQTDSDGGLPKTTAEMKTQSTFTEAGWDFCGESANGEDNTWVMNPGVNSGYPLLSWQNNIWNGVGNWNTVANWSSGNVPVTGSNILVASGELTINENVVVTNFTILPQASVTISNVVACTNLYLKSDAAGTASLINRGTLTVAGKTFAEHYLSGSNWHIIAPTAAGGSIGTFIQDATNAIPFKDLSGTANYGMMDYNEASNSWNGYFTASTPGNLTSAKGYSLRRTNDGVVTFGGTLTSGTKTVILSKGGTEGWNCIGNPYPSAISMNNDANASNNFLLTNSSSLDDSFACLYVWDDGAAEYKILGNSSFGSHDLGQNIFQSGQGFFVKAKDAGSSVTFNTAMQSHQTATELKSASTPWPGFGLIATTAQAKASTIVTFNNQMTTGLDVTYDAGLLRGNTGLNLYSRLVDDNGVDFAIQCLPDNYNSLVIPVGIDCKTGGEIIFSAESVELPQTCSIILEDKLTKTFTELGTGGTYQTNVASGNKGTGRFYIHTSSMTTGATLLPLTGILNLNAYPDNGQLLIIGEVSGSAKAHVFDLNGRTLGTFNLQEGSRNSIPVTNLTPGVYLLQVTDRNNRFTRKVVIY